MTSFLKSQQRRLRFKHARSFAYDRQFNSRNLEDKWYPMWDHVLNELIGDHPSLHIAPQYTLWYKGKEPESPYPSISPPPVNPSNRPEKPSRYSTPHPEEIHPSLRTSKRQTETSRKARIDSVGITDEDLATAGRRHKGRSTRDGIPALIVSDDVPSLGGSGNAGGDIENTNLDTLHPPSPSNHNQSSQTQILVSSGPSDVSNTGGTSRDVAPDTVPPSLSSDGPNPRDGSGSAATMHAADAFSRTPDFVILHTRVIRDEAALLYGKYRVTELDIPIIVEVKPYVSRDIVGDKKETQIGLVIHDARDQLFEQAGSLFLNHPNATCVVGIVACGPYWSFGNIRPENISPTTWAKLQASSDYAYIPSNDPGSSSFQPTPAVRWSAIAEIEASKSITRLAILQSALAVFSDDPTQMQAISG